VRRLRFDKSGIHLRDAAIILATNQEPWASYVDCSLEDYYTLGFWYNHYPEFVLAIMTDDALSFLGRDSVESIGIHKVIVRPVRDLSAGWVALP
jgi:hypothetical protein